MTTMVLEQSFLTELRQLDAGQQQEVLDFIGYLRYRHNEQKPLSRTRKKEKKIVTAADLLESKLVGLWQDRDDIGDSVDYARKLRQQAEHRNRRDDAPA